MPLVSTVRSGSTPPWVAKRLMNHFVGPCFNAGRFRPRPSQSGARRDGHGCIEFLGAG